MTSVAFQSTLRKQIRKLPKFLKFVKIIRFYSILLNRVLTHDGPRAGLQPPPRPPHHGVREHEGGRLVGAPGHERPRPHSAQLVLGLNIPLRSLTSFF